MKCKSKKALTAHSKKNKVIHEIAKSGRSECRHCRKFIADQTLRVGLKTYHVDYGEYYKWYHQQCAITYHWYQGYADGVNENGAVDMKTAKNQVAALYEQAVRKPDISPAKKALQEALGKEYHRFAQPIAAHKAQVELEQTAFSLGVTVYHKFSGQKYILLHPEGYSWQVEDSAGNKTVLHSALLSITPPHRIRKLFFDYFRNKRVKNKVETCFAIAVGVVTFAALGIGFSLYHLPM